MSQPENDNEDRYVMGQVAKQTAVCIDQLGIITRVDAVCDFMIDTHTHQLIQIGAEAACTRRAPTDHSRCSRALGVSD